MANEEALRIQAIAMHSQGMIIAEIARELGRSRQWVHKWINRHSEGSDDWQRSLSTAPSRKARKTSADVEDLVVMTRKQLTAAPHMESGAFAICTP